MLGKHSPGGFSLVLISIEIKLCQNLMFLNFILNNRLKYIEAIIYTGEKSVL